MSFSSLPLIYVAGHCGMVGSAIVRQLLAQGHPVSRIVTRTHAQLDLTNQADVHAFFEEQKPDQVYLAAAMVGGIHANNTYPANFIYNNLIIQAAFANGVKQLLFLGSSCIYPTHPDITRYFMTIPEAAQLVIQAGAMAQGGDVFLLEMGQPVRILDLAQRMVELSGLSLRDADHPDGNIAIELTGLRPGEKLYEELLIGDNPQPTAHARILKAREASLPPTELWPRLQALQDAMQAHDLPALRAQLRALVPGYTPSGDIVDWVYQQPPLKA